MQPRIPVAGLSAICFACVSAILSASAHAAPTTYALDPVHTRIAFLAGHAGFSKAIGTFAHPTGTLVFDEADWKASKVDVDIPIASLDLGDAAWQKAVLGHMFLDADKLPRAHFVSTQVEDVGDGKLKITGDLTLHGVTQPVVLDAHFNAHKRHPLTFRRTAGFSATATLSRKAFELGAWPGVIDDRVDVLIEVEASKPKAASSNEPADAAAKDDAADAPQTPTAEPPPDETPPDAADEK